MTKVADRHMQITLKGQSIRLFYALREGKQPPWILIHGMGSSRLAYRPMMERWPLNSAVYAMDLPGFGGSGSLKTPHQMDDYVAAVGAFIDHLHLKEPLLLGHSFGGMVAGEALGMLASRVGGAVLVSSAGFFAPQHAMSPTPYPLINRIAIWITGWQHFGLRMVHALGVDPRTLTRQDRKRLQYGWRHAIEMARMRTFYEDPQFLEKILAAKRPVALIHGDRDPLFPLPNLCQVAGDSLPLWVMPEAGHLPYDKDLEGFLKILAEAINNF